MTKSSILGSLSWVRSFAARVSARLVGWRKMAKTKIEWCDYSINPVKGVCPVGCSYCYARRLYERFGWSKAVSWYPPAFDLLDKVKRPSKFFIGSSFELFLGTLPENWMEYNLATAKKYPQHTFIFLTKLPQTALEYSPFPDNVWMGATFDLALDNFGHNTGLSRYASLACLKPIRAGVKFISFEPLLSELCVGFRPRWWAEAFQEAGIGWIIIGQQTPMSIKTTPKVEWIKDIVQAADLAGIPLFLKENLKPVLLGVANDTSLVRSFEHGESEFDGLVLHLRQEFPKENR